MTVEVASQPRPSLVVESLRIERMPGISSPFELDQLGPGINVIHGPNAIGKSRTSAALQAAIWPGLHARAEVTGRFSLAGSTWHVETHQATATYQRDHQSVSASALGLVPQSQYNRYLLTLHDLLTADNQEFAKLIENESVGGYDLNAARDRLGLKPTQPKPGPSTARKQYDSAVSARRSLKQEDHALRERERNLVHLESKRREAQSAAARVEMFQKAIEHAVAIADREAKAIARAAFRDPIDQMTGQEHEQAQLHLAQIADLARQLAVHQATIDRLKREIVSTGFSGDIPSQASISSLEELVAELTRADANRVLAESGLSTAQVRLKQHRERIAADITDDQLTLLDTSGLRDLGKLSRRLRDAQSAASAEAEVAAWVGNVNTPENLDALRKATDLLAHRLRLPNGNSQDISRLKMAIYLAIALIVVEALILAVVSTPLWAALALFAIPLIWFARQSNHGQTIEQAALIQQQFSQMNVGTPSDWSPDTVQLVLSDLQIQLANATLDEQKAQRWNGLQSRRDLAEGHRTELEIQRQQLLETLGVTIESSEPDQIRQIADSIDHWRHALDDVAASESRISTIDAAHATALKDLNLALAALNEPAVPTTSGARTSIQSLRERVDRARTLHTEHAQITQTITDRTHPDLEREHSALDKIFANLGLNSGDTIHLRDLCAQVDPCRAAQKALDDAKVVEKILSNALADEPELITRTQEQLTSELIETQALAAARDGILETITALTRDLERARMGTSLEQAIEEEATALEGLRTNRDRDYESATAWDLVEFMRHKTRDQHRPAVFLAARNLFLTFTAGEWRLELGNGAFHAVNTKTQRPHPLNELSSGTRVQLLLAVRVAFLDCTEHGPQLPIIFDETLANADDHRANAIIDATIEITRQGRQVVYFTAQHDEVARWADRMAASASPLPLQIIDLAEIRGLADANRPATVSLNRTIFEPLQLPPDTTHDTARDHFRVAPIDIWNPSNGAIDLWYLIPDLDELVNLRQSRVTTWGQLDELHHQRLLPQFKQIHEKCLARVRALDSLRVAWQRGRPRPLNKETLLASGVITDTFRDRVVDLADQCKWDARAITIALNNRELSGYRQNAINDLHEYFVNNAHINDDTPHEDGIIRMIVLKDIQTDIEAATISEYDVDWLLQRLGSPGAAEPDYSRTPSLIAE